MSGNIIPNLLVSSFDFHPASIQLHHFARTSCIVKQFQTVPLKSSLPPIRLFQPPIQGLPGDAEHLRGNGLVALGSIQGLQHQEVARFLDGGELGKIGERGSGFRMASDLLFQIGPPEPQIRLEGIHGQGAAFVGAHRVKDHVLKFPDVAGKIIGAQQGDQFPGEGRLALVEPGCTLLEKIIDQQGQVVEPFP